MVLALGLAGGLLVIAQAWLISRIVHQTFMARLEPVQSPTLIAALIVVITLKAVTAWGREIAGFHAGATVRGQVRRDLLAHLVAVGPVGLSPLPAGTLVSSALEQVEALHNFVARYLPQLALAALLPVIMLVFVFPISWVAGAILLTTAPLIPLFMILVGMGAESISQRHFQALARMSAHFLDVLRGLTTLKLFGRSKAQASKVQSVSRQYRLRTMAVLRVAFLSAAVLEFFSAIAIALVAVYLGMSYLGYLDVGAYGKPIPFTSGFFILLLAPDFFLPLRELGTHYHARADAVGAAGEILKIFDLQPVAAGVSADRETPAIPETIRFQSVSVHYGSPSRPGLDKISFTLNRGERVAVVGESGAGKSTLIHLLMGFINPTAGSILIDDTPLQSLCPDDWRRQTAWIGQNPMLFSGTIRENIALAQPDAGEDLMQAAARHAGVLEFAARQDTGLLTAVGEQGKALSMGQAQRVALARAFFKNTPLLLLDEPTASLDTATEAGILAALNQWSHGRTVLMATHRQPPLEMADRILILKQGRLVAQGTYAQLKQTHNDLLPQPSPAPNPGIFDQQPATANQEPATANQEPGTKNQEPGTKNQEPGTKNQEPGTKNQEPGTKNQEPGTKNQEPITGLRPFITLLGRHWKAMGLGTGLALLAAASGIGLLSLSGWFLAASAAAGMNVATAQLFNFFFPSIGVRILAMTRTAARYAERIVSHEATFRILETLRTWCYRRIEPLVPARLSRHHSGDLLARIITDIDTLDNLYLRVLSPSAVAVLVTVSAGLFIACFNPLIALVATGALAAAGAGIPAWAQYLGRSAASSLNEYSARLRAALVEVTFGLAALLSCGAQQRFLHHLDARHKALVREQFKMSRVAGLTTALMTLTSGLAITATLIIGVAAVKTGTLTGPRLALLVLTVMASFDAVAMLPAAFQYLGQTRKAASRLLEIAQIPPAVTYPARSPSPGGGWDIEFRKVAFGYATGNRPVLKAIDLHIPAACRLAVMGDTGAGKSTLLYLLARFEDPCAGEIRLAGHPLSRFAEEELRRRICIVDQRSHIFSGTIRDNLILARPQAAEEELLQALSVVRLRDFVHSLPDGLDTWVGEAGRLLSGGQARRLAVARAVLSDAPVWVLDEPTEGLDSETADSMMSALLKRGQGKTVVVVTHLPEALRRMDAVVVLRNGRIYSAGPHPQIPFSSPPQGGEAG